MLSLSPDQQVTPGLRLPRIHLVQRGLRQHHLQRLRPPFIFHIPQMFFPPLAAHFECTTGSLYNPPFKYISYFLVRRQRGEKQNWKAWQAQLPTDMLPCLRQNPGAVSAKKAAESGRCTESSKRQQWHDNLQKARVDVCQARRVGWH